MKRKPARPAIPAIPAIAAAALAVLALLAACSSGHPSAAGSGGARPAPKARQAPKAAGSPSAVSFSHCMRSHGVPNFPDPDSGGVLPKTSPQLLGVSSSEFSTAQRACQHLLPVSSASVEQCEAAGVCSPAVTQEMLNDGRRFARCMRTHGVPNWPDPSTISQGRVAFAISVSKDGFDPHSSQVVAKVNRCDHIMPGGGVPLAVSP